MGPNSIKNQLQVVPFQYTTGRSGIDAMITFFLDGCRGGHIGNPMGQSFV